MTPTPPSRTTGWPPVRLVALIGILTIVRLMVAAEAGLVADEAYYRLWSLHLSAGYYDHAPMVAWAIAAGRAIAGDGALGVRLLAPLATGAGSLLLWRAVALLDGRYTANRAVIWFNAMILIGAGSVLMTPDTPSVFFWGATLWALAELVASRDPRWWVAVGIAAGLGLASKYSVLFLGLGIGLWLVTVRDARRWFGAWQLWAGGAIALVLFAPVVLWNAEHEWVSFAKQFGRTVPHEWRPEKLAETIGVQMLLIGLPMVPFLALGVGRALRGWRGGATAGVLPLATGLPFVAYLLFHSLHGGVEGNWPAPLYPALAWLAALGADEAVSADAGPRLAAFGRRLAPWVAPVGYVLVAALWIHATTPIVVLPSNRDPTAQMKGWEAFGHDLERLAAVHGATAFAVPSYALAGEVAFRVGSTRVFSFDEPERWSALPMADPATIAGPVLYVDRAGHAPGRKALATWPRVTPLGTLDRRFGGHTVEAHAVYLLERAAP